MHGTSGTLLTVTMQLHARNSLSIRSPICHTLVVCQNCCTCDISSNFSLYRRPIVLVLSARTLLQNPDGIVSQSMWTLNAGINSKNSGFTVVMCRRLIKRSKISVSRVGRLAVGPDFIVRRAQESLDMTKVCENDKMDSHYFLWY